MTEYRKCWRPGTVAVAGLVSLSGYLTVEIAHGSELDEPVKLVMVSSSDADFIAAVFGEFIRSQGYEPEYITADYVAQFQGLQDGDMHINTGIWDTGWELVEESIASGEAALFGHTGVRVREGWWFPDYLIENCPGLPDYEALQAAECVEALSVAETAPKGRFVAPPIDWNHRSDEVLAAFNLDFEPIFSGSPAALIATMRGAIDREEPIVGYGYSPHWFFAKSGGQFVAFPEYSAECMSDPSVGPNPNLTSDCDWRQGYVWKMGNVEFLATRPKLARMLHLYALSTDDVATYMDKIDNGGMSAVEAATEWLEQNSDQAAEWTK